MKALAIANWVGLALLLTSCSLQGAGEPEDAGADAGQAVDAGPALEQTVGAVPPQTVNQPWFLDLTARGGVPPYYWSAPGPDGLPSGMTLEPSGRLSLVSVD